MQNKSLLLWIVVAMILGGCGQVSTTAEEHLAQAKAYQDQGDLRASVIELKSALQKNPDYVEARWLLGQAYVDIGNGAAAEKELRRAQEGGLSTDAATVPLAQALLLQEEYGRILEEITPRPGHSDQTRAQIAALRGHAHLGQRDIKAAVSAFDKALATVPELTKAQLGHARAAMMRNNLDSAAEWIDKALAAAPQTGEAWLLKGDLARTRQDAEAAEAAYTKAIDNSHNPAPAHVKRATVRIFMGDYDKARQDINTARQRIGKAAILAHLDGVINFQQEDYTAAQAAFEQALNIDDNFRPAGFYLGATHYHLDHWAQAEQHLTQFLNTATNSVPTRILLADIHLRNGDAQTAQEMLRPVVAREPDNVTALKLMGSTALALGDTHTALEHLRRVVSLAPEAAEGHTRLGVGLLMGGEIEQGVRALETAVELEDTVGQAGTTLVMTHLENEAYGKAREAARELQAKHPNSPTPLQLEAMVHLATDNEPQARETLQQALQLAPGDPGAATALANLELRSGHTDKARDLYQQILDEHPDHLVTLMNLAELEARHNQLSVAESWLNKAIEAHPQALRPRIMLSRYYLGTGDPAQALSTVQAIRDQYPDHPDLLAEIGTAQLAINQATNAITTFQRLVAVKPESAGARYSLAKAYAAANRQEQVREQLNKALELAPDHYLAQLASARLSLLEGNLEAVRTTLNNMETTAANNAEVLTLRGRLAMQDSDPQAAAESFAKALEIRPTSNRRILLAQAQWQGGNREASMATLQDWLSEHPDDIPARTALGEILLALQRHDEARQAFSQVLSNAPDHVGALNNLAWLLRDKDPDQALQYAEKAVDLMPQSAPLKDTLGVILLQQGQNRRALRVLREAAESLSNSPSVQFHYAQALAANNETGEARQLLQAQLNRHDTFPEAEQARALLNQLD